MSEPTALRTPKECGARIRRSERTLARWRASRRKAEEGQPLDPGIQLGPRVTVINGRPMYADGDIDAWIAEQNPANGNGAS